MSDVKPEPIFVDGIFIKDIPDTAPEYILADYSINIDKFKAWLDLHSGKAVRGWLNITVKKSQAGKKYAQLNTYRPQESTSDAPQSPSQAENTENRFQFNKTEELPVIQQNEDVNVEDIPF